MSTPARATSVGIPAQATGADRPARTAEAAADAVRRELDRATEAAGALSAALTGMADRPAGGVDVAAVLGVVRRQHAAAEALRLRLGDTVRLLEALTRRADYRARFDADGYPRRRAALAETCAADQGQGLRAYVAAWTDALLAGRYDEAGRLCATPPAGLPAAYGWLPERLAEALAGVREQGPERFEPAGRFLAAGAVLAGEPALDRARRAAVTVLRARLFGFGAPGADRDRAAALLAEAEGAAADAGPEVRAARTALAGHTGEPPVDGTVAAAVDAVHRAAAAAPADLAGWEQVLTAAQQAVGRLADLTGLAGRLDVLVEPVPAELWVAAAGRLAADGEAADAAALLDRAWAPNPVLEAELAALRVALAAPPTAGLLVDAAGTAIWAGRTAESIAAYERALELAPEDQRARYGLADALVVATGDAPLRQARPQLERALALLGDREVTAADAWTLQVEAGACGRLAGAADPQRSDWLWRGLDAAARAVTFAPDSAGAWAALATALGGLQRWRAAHVTSRYAYLLDPEQPAVQEARLIGLVNAGHMAEARELLAELGVTDSPALPLDQRLAWLHAIEAFAREDQGDVAGARRHAELAVDTAPEFLLFRRLAGTASLLLGDRAGAVEHWRVVWREARDDEWEGMSMAAWAALHQGLLDAAIELAGRLIPLEAASVDEGDGASVLGAACVLAGQTVRGRDLLATAVRRATTRRQLDELFRTLPALGVSAADLAALATEREQAYARADAADRSPAAAELAGAARGWERTARLTAALCLLAEGDPAGDRELVALGSAEAARLWDRAEEIRSVVTVGPPPPATEPAAETPDEQKVRLALPATLFAGVPDPLRTHELFLRLLPDARARAAAAGRPALPAVNVSADADLDPDGYLAELPDGPVAGTLPPPGWYAPAAAAELVPGAEPWADGLVRVPAVGDPLVALLSRSPVEVGLRAVADEYARRQVGTTPA